MVLLVEVVWEPILMRFRLRLLKELRFYGTGQQLSMGLITIEITDQYRNMREKVEPVMHIVDLARDAMEAVDIEPIIKPIRGGTDGAQLSFMGLPCPNIFAGGHNFHGKYEYVPVESIKTAAEVIVKLAELTAKKYE